MDRFFDEHEAHAHAKARKAWLEAAQAAEARSGPDGQSVRQVSHELLCDCGKRHLIRVSISCRDGLEAVDDGRGLGRGSAGNGCNDVLKREVEDHGSRLKPTKTFLDVFHAVAHDLSNPRKIVASAFDSINWFEDSPAGQFLGLLVLFALPLALLALNEGGLR